MTNASDDAVPIAQVNLIELLAKLRQTHRPQRVRSPDGGELVVLEATEYDQMRAALEIANSLLQGMADTAAGHIASDDEAQTLFKAQSQQVAPPPRPSA